MVDEAVGLDPVEAERRFFLMGELMSDLERKDSQLFQKGENQMD